jgi:hypothetical protein
MIRNLTLTNFKGFERFEIHLREQNWLVGPNNAGKSTIIAALRTVARMAALAQRRGPEVQRSDRGAEFHAYLFPPKRFGLVEENLRHEFRDVETRLSATFGSGARLTAIWPSEADESEPYFYLVAGDGVHVRTTVEARAVLPSLGVVPILSPVTQEEQRLTADYVRDTREQPVASRHARNELRLMQVEDPDTDGYDDLLAELLDWARPWTPDFRVGEVVERMTADGVYLDVFCRERGSSRDRELFWAGDGIQVWIQVLTHLFRNQHRDTLLLDEPDLYLHADLQRRLVRMLEAHAAQTIASSHSAEVLVEAPPDAVIWIARQRRRAVRAPTEKIASELTAAIGSQFNMRLARALRAQAVVFVEGDDMRLLRNLAKTIDAPRLATEAGIVTVPLQGFSNWEHIEPFAWLIDDLLEHSVNVMAFLDRDYRTEAQVKGLEKRLRDVGVFPHVWKKKELESYLLIDSAIARRSGASVGDVSQQAQKLASAKRAKVFAQYLHERHATEVAKDKDVTAVTEAAQQDFDALWASPERRLSLCNAKEILAGLNSWLQETGKQTLSARLLSVAIRAEEIPGEMREVLLAADELAA